MPRGNNRPQRYTKMIATRITDETYREIKKRKGGDNVGEWLRELIEKELTLTTG